MSKCLLGRHVFYCPEKHHFSIKKLNFLCWNFNYWSSFENTKSHINSKEIFFSGLLAADKQWPVFYTSLFSSYSSLTDQKVHQGSSAAAQHSTVLAGASPGERRHQGVRNQILREGLSFCTHHFSSVILSPNFNNKLNDDDIWIRCHFWVFGWCVFLKVETIPTPTTTLRVCLHN